MSSQDYQLIRSRRRTLALEILRDGTLAVRAPQRITLEFINKFIEQRRRWIERNQRAAKERVRSASQMEPKSEEEIEKLKEVANQKIYERVSYLASLMGLSHGRIRITNAKSRWGSCQKNGNLTFSWRLVMAPWPVIDYVVIHELTHLLEHNHSRRFWERVRRVYPEYKNCRKWLKDNGHLLMM